MICDLVLKIIVIAENQWDGRLWELLYEDHSKSSTSSFRTLFIKKLVIYEIGHLCISKFQLYIHGKSNLILYLKPKLATYF